MIIWMFLISDTYCYNSVRDPGLLRCIIWLLNYILFIINIISSSSTIYNVRPASMSVADVRNLLYLTIAFASIYMVYIKSDWTQ